MIRPFSQFVVLTSRLHWPIYGCDAATSESLSGSSSDEKENSDSIADSTERFLRLFAGKKRPLALVQANYGISERRREKAPPIKSQEVSHAAAVARPSSRRRTWG